MKEDVCVSSWHSGLSTNQQKHRWRERKEEGGTFNRKISYMIIIIIIIMALSNPNKQEILKESVATRLKKRWDYVLWNWHDVVGILCISLLVHITHRDKGFYYKKTTSFPILHKKLYSIFIRFREREGEKEEMSKHYNGLTSERWFLMWSCSYEDNFLS